MQLILSIADLLSFVLMIVLASHTNLLDAGRFRLFDMSLPSNGIHVQVITWLTAFIMTLYAMFCSVTSRVTKKLPEKTHEFDLYSPEYDLDHMPKEEFRPPSPSPFYKEVDLLSSVLKRLGELEEKVDELQAKPSKMPYEKEELLDAAVRRVDALEAELIATKKVSFDFIFWITTNLFAVYCNQCR